MVCRLWCTQHECHRISVWIIPGNSSNLKSMNVLSVCIFFIEILSSRFWITSAVMHINIKSVACVHLYHSWYGWNVPIRSFRNASYSSLDLEFHLMQRKSSSWYIFRDVFQQFVTDIAPRHTLRKHLKANVFETVENVW